MRKDTGLKWSKVAQKAASRAAYALAAALVTLFSSAETLTGINWNKAAPGLIVAVLGAAVLGGGRNAWKHKNDP